MRPVLAVFAALFLVSATPQQNVVPPAGETIEVSIVNLDLVVTDKSGKRVKGLTRDDFIVLEDGKPQPISNFAEYDEAAANAAPATVGVEGPAPAPKSALPKRTIIVFADQLILRSFDVAPFFEGLRESLHRLVRPGDDIMIVTWYKTQPVTRLRFTDDLEQVDQVLAQMEKENGLPSAGFDSIIKQEREFYRTASEIAAAHGYRVDFSEDDPTLTELAESERVRKILIDKIHTVRSLVQSMSADEGKKLMILVTHRLSRFAAKDIRTPIGAQIAPRTTKDMEMDLKPFIEDMIRSANANDVTLYGLYPEGLQDDPGLSAEYAQSSAGSSRDYIVLDNELETLSLAADRTGGAMQWAASEVVKMLPSIEQDLTSYYSIAYRVPAGRGDRSHRVVVKAKNPALRVRTRAEFVQKSDDTEMRDRVTSNLLRDLPGGSIPVELSYGSIAKKGRQYRAPLRVRIPVSSLMTVASNNGASTGAFSVYVGWNGVLGRFGDVTKQTRNFEIKRGDETRARAGSFTYDFELMLDDKTENIAVAVFDEVSKEYGVARIELPPRGEE